MRRPVFWLLVLAAAAAAAVSKGFYALVLGTPVRGDEAVNAVMALRIARGEDAPLFLYGVDYLSSVEAWAAGLFWRLFGVSDVTFRILPWTTSVGSVVLLGLLGRRLFGAAAGAAAAWMLVLAPPFFAHLMAIAIGGYAEGLFCALLAWLAFLRLRTLERLGRARPLHYAGFSLLAGVSWWVYPMILPFLLPVGLVWMRHPRGIGSATLPWRDLLLPHRAAGVERPWRILAGALQAANLATLAILAWILATGGGDFSLMGREIGLSTGAKVAFWNVVLSGAVAGILAWRRGTFPVTRGIVSLAAGVVLGKCAWIAETWRLSGEPPDTIHLRFKLAQGADWAAHGAVLLDEILPGFLGIVPGRGLTDAARTAWIAAGVAAIAWIAVRSLAPRVRGIAGLFALAGPEDRRAAFLSVALVLPLLNLVRGGPDMPIRYWAYLWPVLAIAAGAAIRRRPRAGAVLAAALLAGASGWSAVRETLSRRPFDTAKQEAVLACLRSHGVAGGYAEYDMANALTYMSREEAVFAPFDYRDRIPGIAPRLAALPRHAWVFHAQPESPDRERSEAFRAHLAADGRPFTRDEAGGMEVFIVDGPPVPLRWTR